MLRKKKLSKRLAAIARIIEDSGVETVCDVGTDHCYLPIHLAARCKKVIACDRLEEPLARARRNINLYKMENCISLRCGDGLSVLADFEAEAVVIAGMGGREIAKILSTHIPYGIKIFIFQPMNNYYFLRRSCMENSLKINREFFIEDNGRLYLTMLCSFGSEVCSDFDLLYGKFIPYDDSPYSQKYLRRELSRLIKISTVSSDPDVIRIIDGLREVLKTP